MSWQVIGNYLGREVEIKYQENFYDWSHESLRNSVVLLYLGFNIEISMKDLECVVKKSIHSAPLAIALAGNKKDLFFDLLLKRLSEIRTIHHIMSKKCNETNIKDILEDFLIATWPSEGSFDDWNKYSIIFFGDKTDYCVFKRIVREFLI